MSVENKINWSEFEGLSTEEWKASIEKYLKGKPLEELEQSIEEGYSMAPFYRKEEVEPLRLPSLNAPKTWAIAEKIEVAGDLAASKKAVAEALNGGANMLILDFQKGKGKDIREVLQGVHLNMISLKMQGEALGIFAEDYLRELGRFSYSSDLDLLLSGNSFQALSWQQLYGGTYPKLRAFQINICLKDGAITALSDALTEIKFAFEELRAAGAPPWDAQHYFQINFELEENYFRSISAIRAFKRLWLGVLEAQGLEKVSWPWIHAQAVVAERKEDLYWQMIANSTQALAAAVGQVNSLELPILGTAEQRPFARRIARNAQHLLQLESHLNEVENPAAGAYYIEKYSQMLVKASWEQFLEKA